MKIKKKLFITFAIAITGQVGCGVRGDPVPPKIPSELGRGQPTYKGATEELAFPTVPPVVIPNTIEDAKKKKDENEKK